MGSSASGRYGRRSSRATVEQALCIDAGQILNHWKRGVSAALATDLEPDVPSAVDIDYLWRGEKREQRIAAIARPQHFGGARLLFGCPTCGHPRVKLYLAPRGSRFECRDCARLDYRSQRLGTADRWRHRAAKLYARVGTNPDADYHYKPKRMRWATFNRIMDAAQEYDDAAVVLGLGAFLNSLERADEFVRSCRADRRPRSA